MIKEIASVIEHANRKLAIITKDGYPERFEDVRLTVEEGDFGIAVLSGTNQIWFGGEESFAEAKAAIWSAVDNTRARVQALVGDESPREVYRERPAQYNLEAIVSEANAELRVVTATGFPFSFGEVEIRVESDRAGLYVYSGAALVAAIAKGHEYAVANEIRDVVEVTRVATERRGHLREEARKLCEESQTHEKCVATLEAAGLPATNLVRMDSALMERVKRVAQESIRQANKALDFVAAGGFRKGKLALRIYSLGFVVLADGKPCLVTRFPRVLNNKSTERLLSYISSDIAALADSRRRYFAEVRSALDAEATLRQASRDMERAEQRIAAVM